VIPSLQRREAHRHRRPFRRDQGAGRGLLESDLEIRPYYEAADFGKGFTPEEQAREADLRKRICDV
jgi:hypothetical protein